MVLINKILKRHPFLSMIFLVIVFSGNAQTIPSNFNLIAYEGFNYTSGSSLVNVNGGTGWTNPWTKAYMDKYLKTSTTGFTYPGLTTTGLKAEFDFFCYGSCNQIAALSRSIPLQSEGVVYFQFISVFEASGGGGTPQIRLYNGTTYVGTIGAGGGSFMSIYSLTNNSSSTASLSAQNFVVVRIDYNLNKTEMWTNPDLSTFNYLNPMRPSASILGFSPSFNRMDIYLRSGSIDEITILSQISIPSINKNGNLTINTNEHVNQNGVISPNEGLSINGKVVIPD